MSYGSPVLDPPWANGRRQWQLLFAAQPFVQTPGMWSRLQSLGVGTDVSSLAQSPSTQKCGPGLLEWPRKMEHGGKRTELGREDKGGCPVGLGKGDAQGK